MNVDYRPRVLSVLLPVIIPVSALAVACENRAQDLTQEITPTEGELEQGETQNGGTEPGARAQLQVAEGVTLTGSAEFYERNGGVRVVAKVENAPAGEHGIHVHEKGDCSDIRGKSMGGHFAPSHQQHGLPPAPARHLGDLGNITVNADGKGQLDLVVPQATLESGAEMSFLGKALVVHEKQDTGQGTSGESGDPIACGVIEQR